MIDYVMSNTASASTQERVDPGSKEDPNRRRVVCTGRRRSGTGKGSSLIVQFCPVDDEGRARSHDPLDGEWMTFNVDKWTRAYEAGYVYDISYDPTTRQARFGKYPKMVGFYSHDPKQAAAWQAQQRAEETTARAARRVNNLEMVRLLEPLRREYHRTDGLGKLAIETTLLYYLRYGQMPEDR